MIISYDILRNIHVYLLSRNLPNLETKSLTLATNLVIKYTDQILKSNNTCSTKPYSKITVRTVIEVYIQNG